MTTKLWDHGNVANVLGFATTDGLTHFRTLYVAEVCCITFSF